MLARCSTRFDRRRWPSPWREMCSTSAPAKTPRETGVSPQSVLTSSGPSDSNPGSAYVPEPVMIAIGMAREYPPKLPGDGTGPGHPRRAARVRLLRVGGVPRGDVGRRRRPLGARARARAGPGDPRPRPDRRRHGHLLAPPRRARRRGAGRRGHARRGPSHAPPARADEHADAAPAQRRARRRSRGGGRAVGVRAGDLRALRLRDGRVRGRHAGRQRQRAHAIDA